MPTNALAIHTSIVVDLRFNRCDHCKVALRDPLAIACPVCGAHFDSIVSNHVGLAAKLYKARATAGVTSCAPR